MTGKHAIMARYGEKAGEMVEKALHEMHDGELTIGKSDKKVTSRKQAIAIGLSEAREAGGKVPKKAASKKSTTSDKSAAPKKSAAKKTAAKKSTTSKKSTAKKAES
jgi:topoisomerase IA-like protein